MDRIKRQRNIQRKRSFKDGKSVKEKRKKRGRAIDIQSTK